MATKTTGPVALHDVKAAIHKGIRKAFADYPRLSGEIVNCAPEYYMTVKIADELKKLKLFVDLECGVEKTLDAAGAKQPGPVPKLLKGNGRFDFVAHSMGEKPRFVGEVKHPVNRLTRIERDLTRICKVLKYGDRNSFQAGIIAFYVVKDLKKGAQEKLLKTIERLGRESKTACADLKCSVSMEWKQLAAGDDYASASVCLIIKK